MFALTDCSPTLEALHANFLGILARLEIHGRVYFRHLQTEKREEAIAEMLALCWAWFLRLAERGKDATQFPSALATYAARAVRNGRKLAGMDGAKDVLSGRAQRQYGFRVEPLPSSTRTSFEALYAAVDGQRHLDAYEERLRDNTVTPPPLAAAFRVDWPCFLSGLTERDRDMALYLSLGHHAHKAAHKFGLSPGRVTQLRQRWCREWRRCQGDEVCGEMSAPV